jgi:hypothetical protein
VRIDFSTIRHRSGASWSARASEIDRERPT